MINILDLQPEEVLNWEIKKLWVTLNNLKNDISNDINQEEYIKIKYGIIIDCPIWYLTEEWYEIHPSSKKVTIKGYGKYDIKDFMEEKEQREQIMRQQIINNIEKNNVIEARV